MLATTSCLGHADPSAFRPRAPASHGRRPCSAAPSSSRLEASPRSSIACRASSSPRRQQQRQQQHQLAPPGVSSERDASSSQPASDEPTKWRLASALAPGGAAGLTRLLGIGGLLGSGLFGSGFDLAGPGSVVQSLGVLAAVVTVHECGHFFAARSQGIHVSKFAIGFGPPLITYQPGEVEFTLRAIPLGGYVAFPDDDEASPYPEDDPNLLRNRPVIDRVAVVSAGVIANFIFAYAVLFAQASTVGVVRSDYRPGVRVPEVIAGSVADRAGVKQGDIILRIGGEELPGAPSTVGRAVALIRASPNRPLPLTVFRGGGVGVQDLSVTPSEDMIDGGGRIGCQLAPNARLSKRLAAGPADAAALAGGEFSRLFGSVTGGLSQIVTNFSKTADQVSGPVAILKVGAQAARSDVTGLFQFGAILNINLAVVNILPLPALDGGFLALLLLEGARGKRLPVEVEQSFSAAGLLLLTGLGVALIFKDVTGLFK